MRRYLLALLAAAALLLPLAAHASLVGGGAWQPHTIPSLGFTISTPSSWVDITSSSPSVLEGLVHDEPSLKQLVRVVESNKLVKFFSVDPTGNANVNVIATPIGNESLATWVQANMREIKGLPEVRGLVSLRTVRLPSGAAYIAAYKEVVGTHPAVETLQYYTIHDGTSYVVTFTTSPSLEASYRSVFRRSAQGIHFGNALPTS